MAYKEITVRCTRCAEGLDAASRVCQTCTKKENQTIDVDIKIDKKTSTIYVKRLTQRYAEMPVFIPTVLIQEGYDPANYNNFHVNFVRT
jgi:hypothetical protein